IDEDRRDSAAAVEASFAQPEELGPEEVIAVGEDEIAEEYERFPADGTPPESEATLFGRLPSAATVPVPRPAPRPAHPTTPPRPRGSAPARPRPPPAPAAPAPPVPPPSGTPPPAPVAARPSPGESSETGPVDIVRPPVRPAEAPKERPAEAPKTLLLVDDEE